MKTQSLKNYTISFIKQYKIYLLALAFIAIMAAIFDISVNYKIKEIIDTIAASKTAELNLLLALFVFYKLMHHASYFVSRLLDIHYNPKVLQQTVTDIYTKIVHHSLHWFDSHMSGEISNKISDFQNSISTLIMNCFGALNNVATVVLSVFVLIRVNKLTALVLGVFIIIYTPIIYFLLKKQMGLQAAYVSARQETVGIINDSIANIFGIKIIGNVWTEFKLKLMPAITKWRNWDKKTRQFDAYFVDNADTVMITLMSAAQIYLLAYLYQHGKITAGGFAFISMITLNIHGQLDKFLDKLLFSINPAIAQVISSYAFVSNPYDVQDKEDAKILNKVKGEINYHDVAFAYGKNERQVLQKFNLHINAGESLGIVGTSGAGKTTLIKCLLRYFDVNQGHISVDGNNIAEITQESLRKKISIIPQDITMFHRSIRENMQLAKHDATEKEIIAACKKAKIHKDILLMHKGYESIVGERGVKLSGGQRQRVAIARAILKNAPILILDEATSSLDTPTEVLIQQSINEMLETSKATVIAIAHRLSTLKHMDRIIVLDKGKIVEEGTHNALIRRPNGLYKKLWNMQVI